MKLDLTQKLLDFKGRAIKDGESEVTLGEALAHAYLTPDAASANGMKFKEKLRRYKIAEAIATGGIQDFKEAEIDEIRTIIEPYPIPILGAILKIIDAISQE